MRPDSTNGAAFPSDGRPFRLKAPQPSEDDIKAGCITILELRNYWVVKLLAGVFETLDHNRKVRGAPKGTPDFACMHGTHRSFLLEVKRTHGGRLSDDQKAQIDFLRIRYHLPIVVVKDPDELCNFLAEHERSP